MLEEITYTEHQVICEHPRIVVNPLLPELLAQYGIGCINGKQFTCAKVFRRKVIRDWEKFRWQYSPKKHGITHENLSQSFVLDAATGETYPIYVEVPCNNCPVCQSRKTNAYVQRCRLETLAYDSMPWFITLTYSPKYLPKHGVDKDDVQRYMKRLRIHLQRAGFNDRIRYVLSAEYGNNYTRRAHYHAIIWNLPVRKMSDYLAISDIIDKSWSLGNTKNRVMNAADDKCLYYTCKYVFKAQNVPKGKNAPFFLASNGNGGIGSRWIDDHADEIRKSMNTKYKYLDKFSGKVNDLCFDQYILNRVFPSFCRAIPAEYRQALQEFSRILNTPASDLGLYREHYLTKYKEYQHTHFQHVFDPYTAGTPYGQDIVECSNIVSYLEQLTHIIDKQNYNYEKVKETARKRTQFVSRLFLYSPPVDIQERAWSCRRRYFQSVAREVL